MKNLIKATVITLLLSLCACSTAYFNTLEKFGIHKRDLLATRVEAAKDSQEQAKQEFKSALEQFKSVVHVKDSDLERTYNKLNDAYTDSKTKAENVTTKIGKVESVADALFSEWKSELEQYSSANLRASSQKQLDQTKQKYKKMLAAMRRAESKIPPVLTVFNDQVLYLKHNLNARAITAIQDEVQSVESDVGALVAEMERSISEATSFISTIKS